MVETIPVFAILVVNHTIFSSLGLYFIRGYGELLDTRKFFFLSMFEMGIPLVIYLALRKSGLLLSSLAVSIILVYFAVFIALTRLTYTELHTGQIFIMIAVNGIGVTLLGLLNSFGPFFLYSYLIIIIFIGLLWISEFLSDQNRLKQIKRDLPEWERKRKEWIREQLTSRKNFHTFCFECCHFNTDRRTCGLELQSGSIAKIGYPYTNHETYCLYWNADDNPNIKMSPSASDRH